MPARKSAVTSSTPCTLSTAARIHTLPDELILHIFRCANPDEDDENDHNRYAMPLTTVCRRWKRIAVPILYEKIQFDTYDQFKKAIATFFAAYERGDPVFSWIRSLNFRPLEWDIRATERRIVLRDTEDLIMRTHNLEAMWMLHDRLPVSSLLVAVGRYRSESLRKLDITIDENMFPSIDAMQKLTQLGSLTVLVMAETWPNDSTRSWNFPYLTDLVWLRVGYVSSPTGPCQDIMFLDKSQFGCLRCISLSLASGTGQPQTVSFESFLRSQPDLEVVHFLDMEPRATLVESLIPCVPSPGLQLSINDMPSGFLDVLPPCIRVLHLDMNSKTEFRLLMEFVNDIVQAKEEPTIREIHIEWQCDVLPAEFSWTSSAGEINFLSKLRKLLISLWWLLYTRGVQVYDERGRTPSDCGIEWSRDPDG